MSRLEAASQGTPVIHPDLEIGITSTGDRYDIEADWILMTTCNFRCEYCFLSTEALSRKISTPASVQHLASFFDDTKLTWLLHLTGGEPFHYPDFVELCSLLTRKHFISINTNTDSDRVRQFAQTIDPARVDFINCGVHLQQREQRHRENQFVRNVHALKDAGFDAFVSCVMYPPIFRSFHQVWERYAAEGVILIPKSFRGPYLGAFYPAAYTDEQRSVFIEYSHRAEQACREQIVSRAARPTIDPFLDASRFLHTMKDFRGTLCHAGRHFVRIKTNGDIQRCGPEDVIGNIVQRWFGRRSGPSLCKEVECPYFCEKYRVRPSESEGRKSGT